MLASHLVAWIVHKYRLLCGGRVWRRLVSLAVTGVVDFLMRVQKAAISQGTGLEEVRLRFSGGDEQGACIEGQTSETSGCGLIVCRRGMCLLCSVLRGDRRR